MHLYQENKSIYQRVEYITLEIGKTNNDFIKEDLLHCVTYTNFK